MIVGFIIAVWIIVQSIIMVTIIQKLTLKIAILKIKIIMPMVDYNSGNNDNHLSSPDYQYDYYPRNQVNHSSNRNYYYLCNDYYRNHGSYLTTHEI